VGATPYRDFLREIQGSVAGSLGIFCGKYRAVLQSIFFFFLGFVGLFLQDIYGSFASYSLFKKSPVSPATRALNLLEKMPICPVSHIKMSMAMATSFFAIQKEPYISIQKEPYIFKKSHTSPVKVPLWSTISLVTAPQHQTRA